MGNPMLIALILKDSGDFRSLMSLSPCIRKDASCIQTYVE